MAKIRKKRNDNDWLELINECRSSGLTDKDWCRLHRLSSSSFYYHIRKLRKNGYDIPSSAINNGITFSQEVVPVEIKDEGGVPMSSFLMDPTAPGTSPVVQAAICIRFRDIRIEILNGAGTDVIRNTLSAVGSLC